MTYLNSAANPPPYAIATPIPIPISLEVPISPSAPEPSPSYELSERSANKVTEAQVERLKEQGFTAGKLDRVQDPWAAIVRQTVSSRYTV